MRAIKACADSGHCLRRSIEIGYSTTQAICKDLPLVKADSQLDTEVVKPSERVTNEMMD